MVEKPTTTVQQLLERKKRTGVISVAPGAPVLSALKILAERNIGAVVVLEDDRLVGILSERDYARKVELQGRTAADTPVRAIMTENVIHVAPDRTVAECRRLMNQHGVRHLPVLDGPRVIGVLSSRDVLEEVIAEDEHVIRDLEKERLISTTDTGTY